MHGIGTSNSTIPGAGHKLPLVQRDGIIVCYIIDGRAGGMVLELQLIVGAVQEESKEYTFPREKSLGHDYLRSRRRWIDPCRVGGGANIGIWEGRTDIHVTACSIEVHALRVVELNFSGDACAPRRTASQCSVVAVTRGIFCNGRSCSFIKLPVSDESVVHGQVIECATGESLCSRAGK